MWLFAKKFRCVALAVAAVGEAQLDFLECVINEPAFLSLSVDDLCVFLREVSTLRRKFRAHITCSNDHVCDAAIAWLEHDREKKAAVSDADSDRLMTDVVQLTELTESKLKAIRAKTVLSEKARQNVVSILKIHERHERY